MFFREAFLLTSDPATTPVVPFSLVTQLRQLQLQHGTLQPARPTLLVNVLLPPGAAWASQLLQRGSPLHLTQSPFARAPNQLQCHPEHRGDDSKACDMRKLCRGTCQNWKMMLSMVIHQQILSTPLWTCFPHQKVSEG